jgi:hypothetical protein
VVALWDLYRGGALVVQLVQALVGAAPPLPLLPVAVVAAQPAIRIQFAFMTEKNPYIREYISGFKIIYLFSGFLLKYK